MNGIRCGKCLLREFDAERFAASIQEYIALIPPDKKAAPEICQSRLVICRSCDMLTDGLCGECGCFVEVRAAKRDMDCPVHHWET